MSHKNTHWKRKVKWQFMNRLHTSSRLIVPENQSHRLNVQRTDPPWHVWLSCIERHPINQKAVGSAVGSCWGVYGALMSVSFRSSSSLPLPLPLPSSLSKSNEKNVLGWGLKKKKTLKNYILSQPSFTNLTPAVLGLSTGNSPCVCSTRENGALISVYFVSFLAISFLPSFGGRRVLSFCSLRLTFYKQTYDIKTFYTCCDIVFFFP